MMIDGRWLLVIVLSGSHPAAASQDPEAAAPKKPPSAAKTPGTSSGSSSNASNHSARLGALKKVQEGGILRLLGLPASFTVQEARGPLGALQAREVLSGRAASLGGCRSDQEGRLELEVEVRPGGAVGKVAVRRSSGSTTIDRCVCGVLRRTRFPARAGASRLRLAARLSAGMASVFGPGGLGTDVQGGLIGNPIGDARGYGGLGLRGTGGSGGSGGLAVRGGGVAGEGTIGIGAIGTIGRGAGGGRGYGAGVGRLGRRGRIPRVEMGEPSTALAGSKEIIRRIIRRNLAIFRYCYDRELVRDPKLQGKVAVRFEIDPQGLVPTAVVDSSTLGSAAVESCVLAAVKRLRFPKLSDGVVRVTYPFTFKPAPEDAR